MTLVQEETKMIEKMPLENQKIVVELLRIMSYSPDIQTGGAKKMKTFKRTGLSDFNLPPDFDEHFDDADAEIARLFYGGE